MLEGSSFGLFGCKNTRFFQEKFLEIIALQLLQIEISLQTVIKLLLD